jgi:hypothetical protein
MAYQIMDFLETLRRAGWQVRLKDLPILNLVDSVRLRYPNLSGDLILFLSVVDYCANADNNVWFLCEDDYNGMSDSAYRWNEFELMSLEVAQGSPKLILQVEKFWNLHIPFLISVKGDYAFLAISESDGSVVSGFESEFEEVVKVCDSFSTFTELFSKHMREQPHIGLFESFT